MQKAFAYFRWTTDVDTAMVGLALNPHHFTAALRAALRHAEGLFAARMVFVIQHAHNFGDYVSAALDHHPVANLYTQPIDLVLIVQCCPGDGGAADDNG